MICRACVYIDHSNPEKVIRCQIVCCFCWHVISAIGAKYIIDECAFFNLRLAAGTSRSATDSVVQHSGHCPVD